MTMAGDDHHSSNYHLTPIQGTGMTCLRVVFLSNRRCPMPDDKSKVGETDRNRVAADQNYEVRYPAEKFGLSDEQALELIARVGNDREKLDNPQREN